MSEDSEDKTAPAEAPAAKVARKRPAVRKTAKARPAPEADSVSTDKKAAPAAPEAAPAPEPAAPAAESPRSAPSQDGGSDGHDAERIAFLVEPQGGEPAGNSKKRRRRKKKHGQGQQGSQQGPGDAPQRNEAPQRAEAPSQGQHSHAPAEQHGSNPAMQAAPRPKLDSELVAKKAWKIFQAEVGEEGLALIDDHDAREISRRCFRLAEIFLEEAARRNR